MEAGCGMGTAGVRPIFRALTCRNTADQREMTLIGCFVWRGECSNIVLAWSQRDDEV